MATTVADVIDPTTEPTIRRFQPKLPELRGVDPAHVAVSYDRRSDTLLMHLYGRDRNSVSVQCSPNLYWLTDPETEEVVGFHIEGFLARAVQDAPELVNLLDYAELRGVTPAEVRALRSGALGLRQRLAAWLGSVLVRAPQERKRRAVASFMDAARSRQGSPLLPASC
jgi:hypothetical protein